VKKLLPFVALITFFACTTTHPASHESGSGGHPMVDDLPAAHSPSEALDRLKGGNLRYTSGKSKNPNREPERAVAQYDHQTPFAAVFSCADSRVPVEVIFDQGIGDIFAIRAAGQSAGASTLGSLEYAVDYLHVPLVVVMGHENCGAVKNAIAEKNYKHFPEQELDVLLSSIRDDLPGYAGNLDKLTEAVKAHVQSQVQFLKGREPVTAKAVSEGRLNIVGAYFNLKSGKVEFLN
jgi:carbonic anhydrase